MDEGNDDSGDNGRCIARLRLVKESVAGQETGEHGRCGCQSSIEEQRAELEKAGAELDRLRDRLVRRYEQQVAGLDARRAELEQERAQMIHEHEAAMLDAERARLSYEASESALDAAQLALGEDQGLFGERLTELVEREERVGAREAELIPREEQAARSEARVQVLEEEIERLIKAGGASDVQRGETITDPFVDVIGLKQQYDESLAAAEADASEQKARADDLQAELQQTVERLEAYEQEFSGGSPLKGRGAAIEEKTAEGLYTDLAQIAVDKAETGIGIGTDIYKLLRQAGVEQQDALDATKSVLQAGVIYDKLREVGRDADMKLATLAAKEEELRVNESVLRTSARNIKAEMERIGEEHEALQHHPGYKLLMTYLDSAMRTGEKG
jgi:hypothetical protein